MHHATQKALDFGAGILVVDTLTLFTGIEDENSATEALNAMKPLKEAASHGIAVIVLRHTRKSGGGVGLSGRGSSAFAGQMDYIFEIERGGKDARPTVRIIEPLGRFDRDMPPRLVVELTDEGYIYPEDNKRDVIAAIAEILPATEQRAISTQEIVDKLSQQDPPIKRTPIYDALKLENLSDYIGIIRIKRGKAHHYYKPVAEDSEGFVHRPSPRDYVRTEHKRRLVVGGRNDTHQPG